MNTGKLQDLVGPDAWEVVSEPRVLFCLDDGHIVSYLYNHMGKSDASGDVLTIEVGKTARVEICGPKVPALHRDFCRSKCTNIKSDGLDILSVRLIPKCALHPYPSTNNSPCAHPAGKGSEGAGAAN
jgi:hypothetical protein